jgi:uncharacterized membrane protein AbrB (regulator of aidB expression)
VIKNNVNCSIRYDTVFRDSGCLHHIKLKLENSKVDLKIMSSGVIDTAPINVYTSGEKLNWRWWLAIIFSVIGMLVGITFYKVYFRMVTKTARNTLNMK